MQLNRELTRPMFGLLTKQLSDLSCAPPIKVSALGRGLLGTNHHATGSKKFIYSVNPHSTNAA